MSILVATDNGMPVSVLLNLYIADTRFKWINENDFVVSRGGASMQRTVTWEQGTPEIENFDIDDITIAFFSDAEALNVITESDDDYNIGDETLAEIITLTNFIDNGDGTGTVNILIDPSDIDATELMADRSVYITLNVNQNS